MFHLILLYDRKMSFENQFKESFYSFIDKVQELINGFFEVSPEESPLVAQSAAKTWFLLEGLNSYLEGVQNGEIDFQIIEIGIDLIAEELFKPHNLLLSKDFQGLLSSYKTVKNLLGQTNSSAEN
ncbi:MAG: hypothetical protein NZT61_02910 [Deltaproteobacteria bacterium]|nr:hypothetical protein [Deltaproteobacteria bacterium]MCX7952395.1 hypothetical protein [Deltaproteobacteria bacterium]